jgi:Flp pilus assembly protein TadD
MQIASWTGDLEGLTPLIVAILIAVAVFYFRHEIKEVVRRLTKIEAKRKDTTFTASMVESESEKPSDSAGTPVDELDDSDRSEAEPISPASTDATDAESIRSEMIRAYLDGKKDKADSHFERLASVETDPVQLRKDQVLRHSSGFIGGVDPDGLEELERRAADPDIGFFVYRMIGICLSTSEKPLEAAEAFQKSIDLTSEFGEKVSSLVLKAETLEAIGDADRAVIELAQSLDQAPEDRSSRENLWRALANAYKSQGSLELRAAALHRVAELAGNDAAKWFRAAYAYSEAGEDHLTILIVHCYRKCLFFEPNHEYAKNNLGVLLDRRDMRISAASHFMQAAQLDNTLAMGNLAEKYLRAGFAEDAEDLLKKAENLPEPDEKIARIRADVASSRSNEEQKLDSLADAGSRAGQFLTKFIRARNKLGVSLSVGWTRNGEEFEFSVGSDDKFVASWSVGSYQGGRRFTGTRHGAALAGTIEAEGASSFSGDSTWKKDGQGYGVISEDGETIDVLMLRTDSTEYLQLVSSSPSS